MDTTSKRTNDSSSSSNDSDSSPRNSTSTNTKKSEQVKGYKNSDYPQGFGRRLNTVFDGTDNKALLKIKGWMDATCEAEYVQKSDRVQHLVNVFMIMMTVYTIASSPGKYFIYWSTFMQLALYMKRIPLYFQYGYQFMMIDFCYIAFIYQLVFLYAFPDNKYCYMAFLGISGVANIIFRYKNMVVFHDLDKM
jgi:hypothetical protein